jgi:hypothetical protein
MPVTSAFYVSTPAPSYSATQLMAGQRQPDGRPLRAIMMAWMTCGDKQRCSGRRCVVNI